MEVSRGAHLLVNLNCKNRDFSRFIIVTGFASQLVIEVGGVRYYGFFG